MARSPSSFTEISRRPTERLDTDHRLRQSVPEYYNHTGCKHDRTFFRLLLCFHICFSGKFFTHLLPLYASFLSHKIRKNGWFSLWQRYTGLFCCLLTFQQICHISAKNPHGIEAFQIFLYLLRHRTVHHIPITG